MKTSCIIPGCSKPGRQRKMCSMHYMRWLKHGDPLYSYDAPEQVSARFWARVDKSPGYGPWGDCWKYTGRLDRDGYGLNSASQSRYERRAHRFAYAEANGTIPDALVVRHKCDVRDCVNLAHLELGTFLDNVADAVSRGRTLKGERNPNAKLSEGDVLEIRIKIEKGYRNKAAVARQYGVSETVVSHIHAGRSWTHI